MKRKYFVAINALLCIVITLTLVHDAPSFAQSAEGAVSGEVKQGSKDNVATITVINNETTTVENLRVEVIEQPKIITNLRIEPASIQRLNPNETKTFTVKFDVPEDAEVDAEDSVKFFISAETGFFDDPYPELTLKIEKPDLPRKLKLVSVLPGEPGNVEWQTGYSGIVERRSGTLSEEITSHCFKQLPLEIEPKEGFNLVFETKSRIEYEDGHGCISRKGTSPKHQKSFLKINNEITVIPFLGMKDLNSYCDEGLVDAADTPLKEATDKRDSTEIVLRFTPTNDADYEYTIGAHLRGGRFEKNIGTPKVDLKSAFEGQPPSLTVEAPGKFELVYGVPKEGEQPIETAAICPATPEFKRSLKGGGSLRYKYGYYTIFAKGSGFEEEQHLRGRGSAGVKRLLRSEGSKDFVAKKRMEWLRRQCIPRESVGSPKIWEELTMWAKGPFDSRAKAKKALIASDWQAIGEVDPDEIRKAFCGGRDDSDTVADVREVPKLYGMSSKEAKVSLANIGLKAQLKPGSPARSHQESGAVEFQFPKPGVKVSKGSVVSLNIHSPFISMVKVPRVKGLSSGKAKALLAQSKLKAKALSGKPAATSSQFGTVQSQKPKPGSKVKAGSSVEIKIYSKYIKKIKVPDLSKMTYKEASKYLRSLGLKAVRYDAGKPKTKYEAHKVDAQNPKPGRTVKAGTKIALYVYGGYEPTIEELVRDTDCSRLRGSKPYWNSQRGKPGCRCPSGYMTNQAGSRCVDVKAANQELCTQRWPGSVATWNRQKGKYDCSCPQGMTWNQGRTRCVAVVKVIPQCDPSQGGRYSRLLRKLNMPGELSEYGRCHDYGWYNATSYKGYKNIPGGYWVYAYPDWYVWESDGRSQPITKKENSQCKTLYFQIRMLMSNKDNLSRNFAKTQAQAARIAGCDSNKISEALGGGGGGGGVTGGTGGTGRGSGSDNDLYCPCVDRHGRRYRPSFGQSGCPADPSDLETSAAYMPCD